MILLIVDMPLLEILLDMCIRELSAERKVGWGKKLRRLEQEDSGSLLCLLRL